jgi:hypothetical protein
LFFAQPLGDKNPASNVSIPGVTGSLQVDVGPAAWKTDVTPGKQARMLAMGREDRLRVFAFLQRVTFAASAERCRKEWWPKVEKGYSKHHIRIDGVQQSIQGDMAVVQYIVTEVEGTRARMKSVHGYLGARDLCGEIHLTKNGPMPEDQILFDQVLASARLLTDDSGAQDQVQNSKIK